MGIGFPWKRPGAGNQQRTHRPWGQPFERGRECLKQGSVWNGSDQGGAQQFHIDKVIEFLEVKIIGD